MASRTDRPSTGERPGPDQLEGIRHPRETRTLHGHESAEAQLVDVLAAGAMPHAWLIGGAAGIGKATLAYRLAKAVLVPEARTTPTSLDTDHDHPGVRRILAGGHGDLMVLRRMVDDAGKAKTSIPVDAVRRLQGFFAHHASEGGWRVAIIDCADDLNRNAANALLKILEEPPGRALLLLAAHAPSRLLPTIRSRCRRLPLKPLGGEAIARILAEHEMSTPPEHRELVGILADGSAGRALQLVQGDVLPLYLEMTRLLTDVARLDAARLHQFVDKATAKGDDSRFEALHVFLEGWIARLIRVAATGDAGVDLTENESAALRDLASRRPLDAWLEAWDKITGSLSAGTPLNLDRKHLLLTAFFTLQATAQGR